MIVQIKNSKIGISVKDLSSLLTTNIFIDNTSICVEAKQKKQEFGGSISKFKNISCESNKYWQGKNSKIEIENR